MESGALHFFFFFFFFGGGGGGGGGGGRGEPKVAICRATITQGLLSYEEISF